MQCTTIAALLSLLSIVQSTSVSVNCVAPWVSTAVRIFDGLPSSEGFYYCSTLLSKYQTVTGKSLHSFDACMKRHLFHFMMIKLTVKLASHVSEVHRHHSLDICGRREDYRKSKFFIAVLLVNSHSLTKRK